MDWPASRPMVFALSSCSTRISVSSTSLRNRATSPAARMSGSLVRSWASTTIPSRTVRPASSASLVSGTMPRPATISSAGRSRPDFERTPVAETAVGTSAVRTSTPFSR